MEKIELKLSYSLLYAGIAKAIIVGAEEEMNEAEKSEENGCFVDALIHKMLADAMKDVAIDYRNKSIEHLGELTI